MRGPVSRRVLLCSSAAGPIGTPTLLADPFYHIRQYQNHLLRRGPDAGGLPLLPEFRGPSGAARVGGGWRVSGLVPCRTSGFKFHGREFGICGARCGRGVRDFLCSCNVSFSRAGGVGGGLCEDVEWQFDLSRTYRCAALVGNELGCLRFRSSIHSPATMTPCSDHLSAAL